MERIMYRKTLDVHKTGIQFMLQGFETADNMARVIEISLMASGDAIDFPLENVEAMMYVTTPNATEPSINKCTIKDNKVVYDVLPIVEEGITTMQLKLIETSTDGATGILAAPKFAVEVTKSDADDESAEQTTTFTALENAMAKAKAVYDERFLRMELSSDCMFRAYYADGTIYETDILQKLFLNGNVLLSESYAHGGTGIRAGEDTDNSMYYSNVSRSEALNAKNVMENSEEILEEVKLHGVYTAFKVDFETGEVEYISPSYKFKINLESGELDAEGETFSYEAEIGRIVAEWLEKNGASISSLTTTVNEHTERISELTTTTQEHGDSISDLEEDLTSHKNELTPISKGGTGAETAEEARANLDAEQTSFEVKILTDARLYPATNDSYSIETTYEDIIAAVNSGKRVFARFYKTDGTLFINAELPLILANSQGIVFMGEVHYYNSPYEINNFAPTYENEGIRRLYTFTIKYDGTVNLFLKPIGGAAVYYGSYVGTGEYGEDYPNSLWFPFYPKLVYIQSGNDTLLMIKNDNSVEEDTNTVAYRQTYNETQGTISISSNVFITKTFDKTTVEWYADTNSSSVELKAIHQMNSSGRLYEYVAIG